MIKSLWLIIGIVLANNYLINGLENETPTISEEVSTPRTRPRLLPRKKVLVSTTPATPCGSLATYRENGTLQYRFTCDDKNSSTPHSLEPIPTPKPVTPISLPDDGRRPECARDGAFCTDHDDTYPRAAIDAALDDADDLLKQFLKEEDNVNLTDATLNTRFNAPGEQTLCDFVVDHIQPTKGPLTRNGEYVAIVNHDKYNQTVRVEKCINAGGRCKLHDVFPSTIETKCEQKMSHHRLLTYDDKKKLVVEHFEFPGCCMCKVINKK